MLALLLACPPGVAAQRPSVPDFGSIRGEVFDSLDGRLLEGAHVRVQGTSLLATTDRQGRFRLDSIPTGRRLLVLDHPALDSVGLTDLPWFVEVTSGPQPVQILLAVPSLRSFAVRACAGRAATPGSDSGVVFGAVRDAERTVRLAGARVLATWLAVDRSSRRASVARRAQDVLSDSLGNYYICGLPSGVGLQVQAVVGTFTSGELQLEIGARRLIRRDLTVSREPPDNERDTVAGSRRGHAALAGLVRGDRGWPVDGALVNVLGAAMGAVSDGEGRFELRELPSGSQTLLVRRPGFGYSVTPVDLRNHDTLRVAVQLNAVTVLDTIRVTASQWVRAEIDELQNRLRFGSSSRVRTAQDLAAIGTIQAALQDFPGMSISTRTERARTGSAGITVRRGGRLCQPDVYIDGQLSDLEVLEQYRPNDLIALEVYPSLLDAPSRYVRPWATCAVVLAWTRYLR